MEHPKKEIGQSVELTEVPSSATQEAQEPPLKHGDIQTEKSPDTIEEENPEALEPDVQELPPVVRKIVSLEDEHTREMRRGPVIRVGARGGEAE